MKEYESRADFSVQDIVNSKKVNQALLVNVHDMFEIEHEIKMTAQLKYLEFREKDNKRKNGFLAAMRHDYLWTATTGFYVGAVLGFMIMRKRFKLQPIHIFPIMMVPVSLDYMKRDYFVSQFPDENKQLKDKRKVVQ